MIPVEEIIEKLKLEKHPLEGGYFRETYRCKDRMEYEGKKHSISTAIYFLLTPDTFSEMHRLHIDEIFHFYMGDPVEMLHLYPDGRGERVIFSDDIDMGMQPQVVVPGNVWQGARLVPGGEYALMGTTVAPGFEFEHYKSGSRKELTDIYPDFKELIGSLTRKP
ncbi:MAG: cupin domain-containing protein [bacterium]|nr:cupin domain-containing protein [bacterium]